MSMLRPADGDYITRGLFFLIGSFMFLWLPFTFVGAIVSSFLFGSQSSMAGAITSFGGFVPVTIFLYWIYLKWSAKNS